MGRRPRAGFRRGCRVAGRTVFAGLALVVGCAAPAADATDTPDSAAAQAAEQAEAAPEGWEVSIAPRPEDVSSIDGMVAAWYDIVSGPAGEARNWARDSTLYLPGVRFVIVGEGQAGAGRAVVTDHGTFAERSSAGYAREGFYEEEIHRVTQEIGNVAYLLSTYQWRRTPDGPIGGRGVNSISLFFDGTRWWITQAMWSDETPGNPIPAELLPDG